MTTIFTPWQCHAHPPVLGGRECGHLNQTPSSNVVHFLGESSRMFYCAGCGCTKVASDDRLRRKEAGRRPSDR